MFGAQPVARTSPDMAVAQPPTDSISKIAFAPVISPMAQGKDLLAVASWDNNVRIYGVSADGTSQPMAMYSHDKPVLDLAWHSDGTKLFSGGCDGAVKMYDLSTGQPVTLHTHAKPVSCIEFVNAGGQQILVSAGWDKELRYWDIQNNRPIVDPSTGKPVMLSDRPYSMSHNGQMLVVATADRKVAVYKWENPFVWFKHTDSPLRWQTRVVKCFPQIDAYAIGSIEGRVGIQYPFHDDSKSTQSPSYSFKCHRYDIYSNTIAPGIPNHASTVPNGTNSPSSSQHVFAVNDVCFHKEYETFCTAGADGGITFWDGVGRTKLKNITLKEMGNGDQDAKPITFGSPVNSCSFNPSHTIFAYSLSYDWSKGHAGAPTANQPHLAPRIMLRPVKADEVMKKKK